MPTPPNNKRRQDLLNKALRLARIAVFGSLSETYRTCGNPTCRCHGEGPKHGPHVNVSFRGEHGKTTGYYVPPPAQEDIRRGIAAWQELQGVLRDLAAANKERILRKGAKPQRRFRNSL